MKSEGLCHVVTVMEADFKLVKVNVKNKTQKQGKGAA